MGSSTLREQNEALFREKYPDVLATLNNFGEPISKLVVEAGEVVNINIDGKNLYPDDFRTSSNQQLKEYAKKPDRIGFTDPSHCNLSPISRTLLSSIHQFLYDNERLKITPYPETNVGYSFIFGVGLGGHLKEFIEKYPGINIVLVEPIPELLTHSLSAIDWAEIIKIVEEKGSRLFFILGQSPTDAVAALTSIVQIGRSTFLDGSYAYIHYPSWTIFETRKLLNIQINNLYTSTGFFEDELLMMHNAYSNFRTHDFYMLDRKPFLQQNHPVFIVGSGPSLDGSLEKVIELRDEVVLVSCGSSSLTILLKNGLVPDFHVETENSHPLVVNLEKLAKEYDLSPITFIGSNTVNPKAGKLFKKRYFYYRPQLSPHYVLNAGTEGVRWSDPLVANAAFANMLGVGFQNVYLFGVDCGKRREFGHHSTQACYYDEDYDNYLAGINRDSLDKGYNIVLPGNFGGEVLATDLFNLSKTTLTRTIETRRANVYNCSNGARIDGIPPLSPRAIKLQKTTSNKEQTIKKIEQQLTHYDASEYLNKINFETSISACRFMEKQFLEAMQNARENNVDFVQFEKLIVPLIRTENNQMNPAYIILQGSLRSMIRLGAFFGNRFRFNEDRTKFMMTFIDQYEQCVLWMIKETEKMLVEMSENVEELSETGPMPGA